MTEWPTTPPYRVRLLAEGGLLVDVRIPEATGYDGPLVILRSDGSELLAGVSASLRERD